jgi:RsiW-degrading membrane proteinase PrsW (M82 family)
MFKGRAYTKPQNKSLLFTLIVAVTVFTGIQFSALFGYLVALACLLLMVVASFKNSFWPSEDKPENVIIFSLFWGIVAGAILPFLIEVLIDDGFSGLLDLIF